MTDTPPSLREQLVAAIDQTPVALWTPGRLADTALRTVQPELALLAALRQVARDYCYTCGRGDAAPTVKDWEEQYDRADAAEAKVADYENRITWHTTCESCARVLDSSIREAERRERDQAAIARVRALCASRQTEAAEGNLTDVDSLWPSEILAALDQPKEDS